MLPMPRMGNRAYRSKSGRGFTGIPTLISGKEEFMERCIKGESYDFINIKAHLTGAGKLGINRESRKRQKKEYYTSKEQLAVAEW